MGVDVTGGITRKNNAIFNTHDARDGVHGFQTQPDFPAMWAIPTAMLAVGDVCRVIDNGVGGSTYYVCTSLSPLTWTIDSAVGGAAGAPGATGPQGPAGPTGAVGTNGTNGVAGSTGPQGAAGTNGAAGAQGIQGIAGATGPQGPAGTNGAAGAQGIQGIAGITGPQGPQGIQGIQGITGPIGATGAAGTNGAVGPTGPSGITTAYGKIDARGSTFASTDGTQQTIDTYALANNTITVLEATITAFLVGSADCADYHIKQSFARSGGGAPFPVGSLKAADPSNTTNAAGWSVAYLISANNILTSVTGVNGVHWQCILQFTETA